MRNRWLLGFGLYLFLAAMVAITIGSLNLMKYRRISNEGKQIVGTVTATDCQNHNLIRYSFEVGERQYAGMGTAPGNCNDTAPGDPVEVWYVPDDPGINVVGSARARYVNELISVSLASLVIPGILTPLFMLTWFRRRK